MSFKVTKRSCNGCGLVEEHYKEGDNTTVLAIVDENSHVIMGPFSDLVDQYVLLQHWHKVYSKHRQDSNDWRTMREIEIFCNERIRTLTNKIRAVVYGQFVGTTEEKTKVLSLKTHFEIKKWERRKRLAGVLKFQNAFIKWL